MRYNSCRHYRGLMIETAACAAGVDVFKRGEFKRPGGLNRIPCVEIVDRRGETPFECKHRAFPTDEEIAAEEAEWDRHIRIILPFLNALKEAHGPGTYGAEPCPFECGGTVQWVRSSRNGHVTAGCTTPKCLSVME